jgi:hypothetical protein
MIANIWNRTGRPKYNLIDLDTGEEIHHWFYADDTNGFVGRIFRDENDKMVVHKKRDDVVRIYEHRNIKLVEREG